MESVATIECYLSSIAKAFDNDKEGTPRVEQMHWAVAASAVDDAVFLGAAYAAMLAKLTLAPGKKSQNWKYIRKVHKAHPRWRIKDIYAEAGKRCLKDGQSWTLKLSTVEKHLAEMT
jgi:hypothetical protein